jgi:serine O-acetyltransferase
MASPFAEDLRRNIDEQTRLTVPRALRLIWKSYGVRALLAYRLGRWLLGAAARPACWPLIPFGWVLYFLISRYVRLFFDIHLALSARIGGGLDIDHFGDIVVERCEMGPGCAIRQSVHIRPAAEGDGPVVGSNVWFGAHARVVGPFRVGDASTIGAGAVVKRDIPPRAFCVGDPARALWRNYDNKLLHSIYLYRGY